MNHFARRLYADERGATAIEYGFIAALISLGILSALNAFASTTISMWTNVAQKFSGN